MKFLCGIERNLSWLLMDREGGYCEPTPPRVEPFAEIAMALNETEYALDRGGDRPRVVRSDGDATVRFHVNADAIVEMIRFLEAVRQSLLEMAAAWPGVEHAGADDAGVPGDGGSDA